MKTTLYSRHLDLGAKVVEFSGWEMPIHYGSQIDEHHAVRKNVGVFDVSHMLAVDIKGVEVKESLQFLLANDVAKLIPGKALYTCMLNQKGGIIDDLIVYQLTGDHYRVVVNAGNRQSDVAWIRDHLEGYQVGVSERDDLAILAVQGPNARETVHQILPAECLAAVETLKPFSFVCHHNWMVARTGYTGEDGYEVILPQEKVIDFWDKLVELGVQPCGLGARDTLRLEAGMNLYGVDMDKDTTPYEAGLAWTVAMKNDRNFVGREALEKQKEKEGCQGKNLVGVVLDGKGVMRHGQDVINGKGEKGVITSGTFSPTMQASIGFASVPKDSQSLHVIIRGRQIPLRMVKYPFVRQGNILV